MRCIKCDTTETKVIESRESSEGECIRRRRECINCATRFTTYERVERPQLVVVKNNGNRQVYSREKLLAGIVRACEKTSMTMVDIEHVVDKIEERLYELGEAEISARKVGETAMEVLADANEVAYVRFASVYRRFRDIASFERELAQMKHQNTPIK